MQLCKDTMQVSHKENTSSTAEQPQRFILFATTDMFPASNFLPTFKNCGGSGMVGECFEASWSAQFHVIDWDPDTAS